jgi:tetratricopeptide (TPR) repeat protein
VRSMRKTLLLFLLALLGAAQTPPPAQKKGRDLKYEDPPAVNPPGLPSVSIPRSYALVIGIANYQNLRDEAQLLFPERDADAIYSILISPEGGNFRAENVKKLTGARATVANIKQELENWLPSVTKDDDRVLIYFAGHGFLHPTSKKGYLAPYDFDPKRIAETGYAMDQLGKVIGSSVKGKWKVLLTDSCHSGAITPEADRAQLNQSLLDLNKSLFSMTASRDREQSFESTDWGGGHGIFTYYVVKGLEGQADESQDGIVTADELAEYVRTQVRQATGGKQNPTSDRGSFDSNMLLSYLPANAAPGAPPAPKVGTLVIEANMDGVEVFVDGKSEGVVNKRTPLRLPGLLPGVHTIKGVRMGYEPDGPREETVYPGQESTVSLKILIPRRRPKGAVDFFEKGLEYYAKGFAENYRRAADEFSKALAADATYSMAALYLGRTYGALFELEKAQMFYKKAIEIDPDYLEARSSYAGMLLDLGDVDEAIRQFDVVVKRDTNNAFALYLLAQAQRMKGLYSESIESARKAIALTPNNGEAHFWLAESLRMKDRYKEAVPEYAEYLRLSDYDTKLAGKIHYYALGYLAGIGRKKRAAQTDIWQDLRSMAYFGMCDAERKLGRLDAAIANCQKSLAYDKTDPLVYYALGLSYVRKAQELDSLELAAAARKSFAAMLEINGDLTEAEFARKNIANIDAALKAQ